MKAQNVTIDLVLNNECGVQIYGNYTPERPQTYEYPGDSEQIEIVGLSFIKGALVEFTQYCVDYMDSVVNVPTPDLNYDTIWTHLEELCLKQYESTL